MFGFMRRAPRPAPQDIVARHARGEMVVIDVRDMAEIRATGTATGCLHVPLVRLMDMADPRHPDHLPELDPARPVALFCATGARSGMACSMLRRLGYVEVVNLGSLNDWHRGGGKVSRG